MTNNKTNLQKRLSKIAFEVTQNAKTEGLLQENILIFLKKERISAFAVIKVYSIQIKSLNQTLGGLVSLTP